MKRGDNFLLDPIAGDTHTNSRKYRLYAVIVSGEFQQKNKIYIYIYIYDIYIYICMYGEFQKTCWSFQHVQ